MNDKNEKVNYLALHAHFYQPPRENPFTGEIDYESSAKPYDNWNHRIAMECYFPNLYARIFDEKGDIIEMINNYDYINFDFGPTLLNWIETYYPEYYLKIINSVKKIKDETGFSPAIAQVYNHTILPLDSFENRITQVHWGIMDFNHRFGFYPDGIWLSEAAVNEDVLRILIDYRIKYVILAPYQVASVTSIKTGKNDTVKANRCYIWYDRDGKKNKISNRSINIFLYDGELSKKISFENITFKSELFSKEISMRYGTDNENFILAATDGETFGHHHKFADLTLSHSFKYELKKFNIKPINLSSYLSMFRPEFEAELSAGPDGDGTSWSCAHGIRRWKGGCNCGDEGIYDTSWRFGLRAATRWLGEVLGDIYGEEGKKIFKDSLIAKKNYIDVMRRKISFNDFLAENIIDKTDANYDKAKKLLLMIKYQNFSNTSCGWFFNDISRIETQQNMRYASKAISIAESFGYRGIEKGFVSLLEMAKSNFSFKGMGNGREIYENYVKNEEADKNVIDAYLCIKTLLMELPDYQNLLYKIKIDNKTEISDDEIYFYSVIDEIEMCDERKINIYFNFKNLDDIKIILKYGDMEQDFYNKNDAVKVEFNSLTRKMRFEIFKLLMLIRRQKNIDTLKEGFDNFYSIIRLDRDLYGEEIDDDLKYYYNQLMNVYIIKFLKTGDMSFINDMDEIISLLKDIDFKADYNFSSDILIMMPYLLKRLFNDYSYDDITKIKKTFNKLNLSPLIFHVDNAAFEKNLLKA